MKPPVVLAVLIGTLVLACSSAAPAPAEPTPNIDATVEARIASIPAPTPQIVIQEVEVAVEKLVIQEVIKEIEVPVKARIASIPTPTPQIVIQEVEVAVEKLVIQEVIKEIEVPVEVTVVVEKLVEVEAPAGETFTDDDGNFGLKFSSHSGYEKHVNYMDQNEHNYSYISDKDFARRGSFYQRFELRDGDCFGDEKWDDCDTDRERIELSSKPIQKPEDIQCFAYSIMLDKAFIDIHPTNTTLGQVHQTGGPSGTAEGLPSFPPIIQIGAGKGRLHFKWHELSGSASNVIDIGKDYDLISLYEMKDKWTDISFCLNYKDKRMDVWINGIKKHEILKSPISFIPESTYFKYGIYRSFISRYKQEKRFGTPGMYTDDTLPTQIVFYDEVRRGNSIEEVDFNINPKLIPVD